MRTSLLCLLLHPDYEQIHIVLDFGTKKLSNLVEYPDICYRCEPDRYLEENKKIESKKV